MPRIKLKPNSAEYADSKPKNTKSSRCEMPGCTLYAQHKAPKHRGLNEYFHFCFEHVREYNKAWDYFSGMSQVEIENHIHASFYGDRPTWRYAGDGSAVDALHNAAWKSYNFTEKEPPKKEAPYSNAGNPNSPEYKAMEIMGLKPPTTIDAIKARYKILVKEHHPDINKDNPKAEETLKEINMAYTILKLAFEEYKRLPDHKF